MKATLILCDHAVVADGKLFIAGGGWSLTGPAPSPSAIALLIGVPWDQTNQPHKLLLWLEREDGEKVMRPDEFGQDSPLQFEADFEVGRPPGVTPGSHLDMPLAINLPPLPLEPGARYQWVLEVDTHTQGDWTLPFSVRQAPTS